MKNTRLRFSLIDGDEVLIQTTSSSPIAHKTEKDTAVAISNRE